MATERDENQRTRGYMGSTPDGGIDDHDESNLPESLTIEVDAWFAQNTGLGGCSDKDVAELAAIFYGVKHEGGRESVEDALAVVESFGPGVQGLNDTFARQVLLAAEVRRLRSVYVQACQGRSDFRNALRVEREKAALAAPPVEQQAAQAEVAKGVLTQLLNARGRKDVLHAQYMGKAMPDEVYDVFHRLRDETIPSLTLQLHEMLAATPPAPTEPAPQAGAAEPDMRAICDALGFDPTNHHNAAKCPYCRPTEQPSKDTERLDFIENRLKAGFQVSFSGRISVREAIDAARAAQDQGAEGGAT